MLNDMIQLHIPDCRLFNSSLTCTLGGALSPSTYNADPAATVRSEEHTSELQSQFRISYAVFCLKKKKRKKERKKKKEKRKERKKEGTCAPQ